MQDNSILARAEDGIEELVSTWQGLDHDFITLSLANCEGKLYGKFLYLAPSPGELRIPFVI